MILKKKGEEEEKEEEEDRRREPANKEKILECVLRIQKKPT